MRQWFVGGIVSRMAGNIFSEGGQKILERIDRLLRKVEQDKAANTVYISYIANLHLGNENTFPIVVQLWNGKAIPYLEPLGNYNKLTQRA